MKLRSLPALSTLLLAVASSGFAQGTSQLSSEAQRAYLAGDLATAKAKFSTVLQMDPSNVVARNYLRTILAQEAQGRGNKEEKQLRTLILPAVKFQDASLSSALEFLKQQAAKQQVVVSFVSQLPAAEMNKPVSLSLSNVPFTEALRYVCQLAGAQAVIEKYAIVIRKPGAPEATSSASPAAQ